MEEQVVKLLLVDDDEDDYLLTKEYLNDITDKKFEVTWAPNFEKGAHEIKYNSFDILIFDFLLGGRNGIDLLITAKQQRDTCTQYAREDSSFRHCPIPQNDGSGD